MIEKILSILIAWVTLSGGVYALFYAMEQTANRDAKRKAANWLKSLAKKSISETIIETPKWFIRAFDSIFGERHLTWRCFRRSCVASITAVFFMIIIYRLYDSSSWELIFFSVGGRSLIGLSAAIIIALFVITLIVNLVPDYLSLLETRWILSKAENAGIMRLAMLLILDVIITGGIFVFWSGISMYVFIRGIMFSEGVHSSIDLFFEKVRYFTQFPIGIYFYAAYFTSIWFYLFTASSLVVKVIYSFGRFGNSAIALLDIDKKPFQSMGILAIALLTGFFALIFVIYEIINVRS